MAPPLPMPPPTTRKPVQRLASIRNPTPSRRTQPPKSTTQARSTTCPNPNCEKPEIVDDDDKKVCICCGTVLSDSNIVAEITFGESSSGAAIVQGTYVGANQSHGRSFGPGFKRSGMESREVTESNGKRYINQLSTALTIAQTISDAGFQIFKLAVGANFIQGRRTRNVAAVCLYIACRRQESNQVMLIDFSDVLHVNVFKLGKTYKALLDELRLGGTTFLVNPVSPEDLIYRFAKQLEFEPHTMQVANEAAKIVQRMNRDWMITGRRPGGICGAALVLAARMNNFRRTVREVVYVVKVTEVTIHQRLDEFKRTESSDLTVEQFRSIELEKAHDPPAFYKAREDKEKKRRSSKKRKAPENAEEEMAENGETAPLPAQRRRFDADGFAIPDLPIDPALASTVATDVEIDPSLTSAVNTAMSELESGTTAPPIGQPRSAAASTNQPKSSTFPQTIFDSSQQTESSTNPTPKQPARKPKAPRARKGGKAAQLASEKALEAEMSSLINDPTTVSLIADVANPGATQDAVPANPLASSKPRTGEIPDTEDISDSEFASDPEVATCLLSSAEVELKERIWVYENRDYLRKQQAKLLRQQLEEESGTGRVIKRRKRKRGRMGDVSYLHGEGGSGEGSRASTPAEATRMMLERRGYSKKINYKLLASIYDNDDKSADGKEGETGSGSGSGSGSRTGTPAPRESFILSGPVNPSSKSTRSSRLSAAPKVVSTAPKVVATALTITPTPTSTPPALASTPNPTSSASLSTLAVPQGATIIARPTSRHTHPDLTASPTIITGPTTTTRTRRPPAPAPTRAPAPAATARTTGTAAGDISEEEISDLSDDEESPQSANRNKEDDEATIRAAFAGRLPPPNPADMEMADDGEEDEDDDEEEDLAEEGVEMDYYDVGSDDD